MDGSRIQEITAEGLVYLTEKGEVGFIDFAVCYANRLRTTTDPDFIESLKEYDPHNRWDDEGVQSYIERRIAWREVARINVIGQPWGDGRPYIEFHTAPPIRFEFATRDEFYDIRFAIENFGWHTFDLS